MSCLIWIYTVCKFNYSHSFPFWSMLPPTCLSVTIPLPPESACCCRAFFSSVNCSSCLLSPPWRSSSSRRWRSLCSSNAFTVFSSSYNIEVLIMIKAPRKLILSLYLFLFFFFFFMHYSNTACLSIVAIETCSELLHDKSLHGLA